MRARVLLAVAVVVLGGAAAVWFWPMERPAAIAPPTSSPASATATPQAPAITSSPPTPAVANTPAPPAAQRAVSSSVTAGVPMVRTTPRPVVKDMPAPAGKDLPPDPQQPDGVREMEDVRLMFRNYLTRLGENPVGSNAEIMKAMMGRNSAAAKLGPPPGHSMNVDGELVDFWGTPYFFHQLSREKMEVRSAGADRRMWTQDDLVTK